MPQAPDPQPPGQLPIRVFLRPIGAPVTIGMSGLGIASLVESGLDLGWIPKSQTLTVGLILVAVPFVLQLLSSIFQYLARDGAGGAAVGVLSATWLAIGLIHIHTATTTAAMGLLLFASAAMILLSATAISLAKPLIALAFTLEACRFAVAGVYEFNGVSGWQHVAGYIGLAVVAAAGYNVLSFDLEGQQHHPVLPTLRLGQGREAVMGDPTNQVDSVASEAGVRQTS